MCFSRTSRRAPNRLVDGESNSAGITGTPERGDRDGIAAARAHGTVVSLASTRRIQCRPALPSGRKLEASSSPDLAFAMAHPRPALLLPCRSWKLRLRSEWTAGGRAHQPGAAKLTYRRTCRRAPDAFPRKAWSITPHTTTDRSQRTRDCWPWGRRRLNFTPPSWQRRAAEPSAGSRGPPCRNQDLTWSSVAPKPNNDQAGARHYLARASERQRLSSKQHRPLAVERHETAAEGIHLSV